MKQRLQSIYLRGILLTLIMAGLAIAMTTGMKITDTQNNLSDVLRTATQWTKDSNDDLQSLAETIAAVSPPIRVMFLMDSGLVLADSLQGADRTVNHYDDPEITAARSGKTGRDLRMSATNTTFVLYMAQRVSPQLILRVSYPVLEIARILLLYGILLVLLFLILYHLQRKEIAKLALDQRRQFEEIQQLLDGEIPRVDAVFPEFQPSLDAISYRIRRLRDDREEILKTMNLRDDFVANASHELRSPLTSIRGFAEMLETGFAETEEEKQLCLQTISSECDRMLDVIEDILRLSKAERASASAQEEREVRPIADEVCQALMPQAIKKEITLTVSGDARIRAEEQDLWEILYNLADNAVRYGKQGGYVKIALSGRRITVEDNGVGIRPEHISHIFEQFYRIDETRDMASGGTGLGLSIVQAIAERCGGRIWVTSEPGEGTCFTVDFSEAGAVALSASPE